jgi:hypothetical protein
LEKDIKSVKFGLAVVSPQTAAKTSRLCHVAVRIDPAMGLNKTQETLENFAPPDAGANIVSAFPGLLLT